MPRTRWVSQGSTYGPVSVVPILSLYDLRRLRKVRQVNDRQCPGSTAVQMRMRMTEAYACAYESAKYLADARACDKLCSVSPGDNTTDPNGSGSEGGWSSALV